MQGGGKFPSNPALPKNNLVIMSFRLIVLLFNLKLELEV